MQRSVFGRLQAFSDALVDLHLVSLHSGNVPDDMTQRYAKTHPNQYQLPYKKMSSVASLPTWVANFTIYKLNVQKIKYI